MTNLFINGEWRAAADGATRKTHCPANGQHVVTAAEATAGDALEAIAAVRAAFDSGPWRQTTTAERVELLRRLADKLEAEKMKLPGLRRWTPANATWKPRVTWTMSSRSFAIMRILPAKMPVA